jgi:hypothetical protein
VVILRNVKEEGKRGKEIEFYSNHKKNLSKKTGKKT